MSRRAAEPGVVILVVLLILSLMTLVGVFGAQSAAMEVRTSGYLRQAMQTQCAAEAATLAAIEEFGERPDAYRRFMLARGLNRYAMGSAELARRAPPWQLYPTEPGPHRLLDPSYTIVLRDVFVSRRPLAGNAVGGGTSSDVLENLSATIDAQVSMALASGGELGRAASTSIQAAIAHVTILNVPGGG